MHRIRLLGLLLIISNAKAVLLNSSDVSNKQREMKMLT